MHKGSANADTSAPFFSMNTLLSHVSARTRGTSRQPNLARALRFSAEIVYIAHSFWPESAGTTCDLDHERERNSLSSRRRPLRSAFTRLATQALVVGDAVCTGES